MNPPAADRRVLVSVPERYVAGADTRGCQEGLPYPWSQQVIHEISGLEIASCKAALNGRKDVARKQYAIVQERRKGFGGDALTFYYYECRSDLSLDNKVVIADVIVYRSLNSCYMQS
jgi:hypothetical protein